MVAASEDESLLAVMVIDMCLEASPQRYDAQNRVIIVDVAVVEFAEATARRPLTENST